MGVPKQVCQPGCSSSQTCNQCDTFSKQGGFSSCPSQTCPNYYPTTTVGGQGGQGYYPGGEGGQGYYPGGQGDGGQGYYPGGQGEGGQGTIQVDKATIQEDKGMVGRAIIQEDRAFTLMHSE